MGERSGLFSITNGTDKKVQNTSRIMKYCCSPFDALDTLGNQILWLTASDLGKSRRSYCQTSRPVLTSPLSPMFFEFTKHTAHASDMESGSDTHPDIDSIYERIPKIRSSWTPQRLRLISWVRGHN